MIAISSRRLHDVRAHPWCLMPKEKFSPIRGRSLLKNDPEVQGDTNYHTKIVLHRKAVLPSEPILESWIWGMSR